MTDNNKPLTTRDWCHKYVDLCHESLLGTLLFALQSFAACSKNDQYLQEIHQRAQKKSS